MLEHRGSIDVVPLEEQLPSYMEIRNGDVITTIPHDSREIRSRYDSNKYARSMIDLLYTEHGRKSDDLEDFIRFLADHSETEAFALKDAFLDQLVQ